MRRTLRLMTLFICIVATTANATNNTQQKEEPQSTYLSVLLNKVKLTGYGQVGYTYNSHEATFVQGADNIYMKTDAANTFDIKRLMFIAEAEVIKNVTMYWMYDFGGTKTHEFWGEYKLCDALKLRVGQYKVPMSLENVMSPATLEVISGSQSVNYLSGTPPVDHAFGGQGGRDQGVMIHGDLLPTGTHKLLSYRLGLFNGQGINQRDRNNHKDIAAWVMLHPLKELAVGGSIYKGKGNANANSHFFAFNIGDNYTRDRWALSAEYTGSPLYLRAEYLQGDDGGVKSEGYYAVAKYKISPRFDIIASYDYFNPNKNDVHSDITMHEQTNYIIGGQWNFYRRCRFQVQYIYQDKATGYKNANVIMTQLQLGF